MLEIATEIVKPGVIVVRLSGKLMMGPESAALEKLINDRIDVGDRHLVFDLHGLRQIDSTGIGRFIACFNRLVPLSGSMGLAGAQSTVRQSFRVTRLDTVFRFFPTVEEAASAV
jgi:anti-sigma B factor antagonist